MIKNCWNCGRNATETCSGCGIARYCGSFCQHKDWENHHKTCSAGRRAAPSSNAASSNFPENLSSSNQRSSCSPNAQNSDSDAGPSKTKRRKQDDVEIAETASLDERNSFSLSGSDSSGSPGQSSHEIRSSSVK
jgi:hypothetical protein